MKLLLLRTHYTEVDSTGFMTINDKHFSWTLEDPVRFTPKKYGITAIPEGIYQVKVTYSPTFKREMPLIIGVPWFSGIRMHGGNTHKNTLGCPLTAKNRSISASGSTIWGSREKELTRRLKASKGKHWIEIINTQMLPMK